VHTPGKTTGLVAHWKGVAAWRQGSPALSWWHTTATGIEGEEWVLESLYDQRGITKAPLHQNRREGARRDGSQKWGKL
jgi:hypothetical protein